MVLWAGLSSAQPDAQPDAVAAAIGSRDYAGLQKLLKAGAPLDRVDPRTHYTYFDLTFNTGDLDALKLLADAGEDVNAPDGMGTPPLIYSVRMGHLEQTDYLLAHGAKLEGRDRSTATALVTAVNFNSPEMVRLLLKAGRGCECRRPPQDEPAAARVAGQRRGDRRHVEEGRRERRFGRRRDDGPLPQTATRCGCASSSLPALLWTSPATRARRR